MTIHGQLTSGAAAEGSPRSAVSATPVQRPSLLLLGTEPLRAAIELMRQALASPSSPIAGDGHPVVIFPGLGAGAVSLTALLKHCRGLGYEAFDWGQGVNSGPRGDFDIWLRHLADQTIEVLADYPQPATLIGWSLGGVYARELAKLLAPRIRQVITIGTPFNVDADYSHAGWLFRLLSGSKADIDPSLGKRFRTPPPVPTTSIYSRSDGIVAWQTCCHGEQRDLVQDIEIKGSHLGMGWNPEVMNVVTDSLLQHGVH